MLLLFKEVKGSATTFALVIVALLLSTVTLTVSLTSVFAAQNRASTAADLVAMNGCVGGSQLSQMNRAELVTCNDDGVSIAVETRSTINLPLRVKTLYAHARAQSVHDL